MSTSRTPAHAPTQAHTHDPGPENGHAPGLFARMRAAASRRGLRGDRRRLADAMASAMLGFRAARGSRLRKGLGGAIGSGDALLERDREGVVRYSRNLVVLSPEYEAFITQLTNLVIGRGLRPRAARGTPAAAAVEAFERWAARDSDIRGMTDFLGLQRQAFRESVIAGESLGVLTGSGEVGAVQVIESEQMDWFGRSTPADESINPGGRVTDGVEVDAVGRVVAFHIAPWGSSGPAARDRRRVDAGLCVWTANRRRPSDTRGQPLISAGLERIAQLDESHEAVHVAMLVAAMFAMVIKSAAPGQTKSVLRTGSESVSKGSGDPADTVYDLMGINPGALLFLRPGEEAQTVQGSQPATGFESFNTLTLRVLAASVGMPMEIAMLDNSRANFSVSRMAELQAQNAGDPMRDAFCRSWCAPVFEWFVRRSALLGRPWAAGRSVAELTAVTWPPPPRKMLDPEKETRAALMAIENNLMSKDDWIVVHGGDPEQVRSERARERRLERAMGIVPGPIPGAMPNPDQAGASAEAVEDAKAPPDAPESSDPPDSDPPDNDG